MTDHTTGPDPADAMPLGTYSPKVEAALRELIATITGNDPDQVTNSLTWPLDVLIDMATTAITTLGDEITRLEDEIERLEGETS